MNCIQTNIPSQCHLWANQNISRLQFRQAMKSLKTYEFESHEIRSLRQCHDCGQLYFFEFYEMIDWENGNDPQYWTYIPVKDLQSADQLAKINPIMRIFDHPSIRFEFGSEDKSPQGPFFYFGSDQ